MLRKLYIGLFLIGLGFLSTAQDIALTQYYTLPISLNPALTGMFNGDYRLAANNRIQWAGVTNKSYVSNQFNAEIPIGNLALGASISNKSAGDQSFNQFAASLSASYRISGKTDHLIFGIQAGFGQTSIDFTKAKFGDGFDPITGYSNTTSEVGLIDKSTYPDFGAGVFYIHGSEESYLNYFGGLSAFHLNEPNQSFYSTQVSSLYTRYMLHGGVKVNIDNQFSISPVVSMQWQQKNFQNSVGLMFDMRTHKSPLTVQFGPFLNRLNTFAFYGGMNYGGINLGLSYDLTAFSKTDLGKLPGSFEFSLIYIRGLGKGNGSKKFVCPKI